MSFEGRRPHFRYAPTRNWINDPNGLIWFDGEYHLFYQYNPLGTGWGNMSWGHAVSPDLVTWTELPVAIPHLPDELVFSGSVVCDRENTAGFAGDDGPALVAVYTAVDPGTGRQVQALAHSLDRGRTWTRYEGNPVLDIGSTEFRDPRVFWYGPGGYWVMAVVLAAERMVRLYRSEDLKSRAHLSDFRSNDPGHGPWECPDLFQLPVDGDPARAGWVLVVSIAGAPDGWAGVLYFVGRFDGVRFTPDNSGADAVPLDFGADYYAAVSFADTPDGERVLVGWMSNWTYAADVPADAFRGSMSIPRVHRLATIGDQIRLLQEPVPTVAALRGTSYELRDLAVPDGVMPLPAEVGGEVLEIRAVFRPGSAQRFGLHVRVADGERTVVAYDALSRLLYVDRTESGAVDFHPAFPAVHHAPLQADDAQIAVTVLVDTASVEVFGGQGECVITDQIFPSSPSTGLAIFAEGGPATLAELSVTPLRRASHHEMTAGLLPTMR